MMVPKPASGYYNRRDGDSASLTDFVNFHGMLCKPSTAFRCINEFRGGTVLFLPNEYNSRCGKSQTTLVTTSAVTTSPSATDNRTVLSAQQQEILNSYDCSVSLTVASYYVLVLVSFTGLLTLLGRTKFLVGRCEKPEKVVTSSSPRIVSESDPRLVIEPFVLDYILQQQQKQQRPNTATTAGGSSSSDKVPSFVIKRRFEYDFGGFCSVMMIHLGLQEEEGEDNLRHGSGGKTHLVEVYQIHPEILRVVFRHIFSFMNRFLQPLVALRSQQNFTQEFRKKA